MKSALGKSAAMEPYYQYLVKEGYFETMKDRVRQKVLP